MAVHSEQILISSLMEESGVKFGTSGARGLATDMTDRVCYAYTTAFLHYLESKGDIRRDDEVAIAGDYRPSSPRIMNAVALAVRDSGFLPVNCGFIPTPAVACYAMARGQASIMVTGSHIPDDRNGIKFYKPTGEVLKPDEEAISRSEVKLPDRFGVEGEVLLTSCFDVDGEELPDCTDAGGEALPHVNTAAETEYIQRYLDFFPAGCLQGRKVGVYQHSSVDRDIMVAVFEGLGASVTALGRSLSFIPVDTEAIRPEDVQLASIWAEKGDFDCLVSADGDGDRPLISDEHGNWLRGDVAGVLCARYLEATHVVTPVSSNSAVEKSNWFKQVARTRIGSPYVIEAMDMAVADGASSVVGYEANGGFLIATDIELHGKTLTALPTRDAVIVPVAILLLAIEGGVSVGGLLDSLPQRFSCSDRLKAFPTDIAQARIKALSSGDIATDKAAIEALFGEQFGTVASINDTDGLRITFASEEVVHLRPSGNAPELRCYNEAATEARAAEMNRICMAIMDGWR
ncbi:phosphomannomutase [Mariprofundus ferrooxydans]|uniref:phosphomannomutase n=1 Tax=Mariprofundus ferrooxydans TaxID=314344 RepID=UPI000370B2AC|nr:phosphomannomutase [Mariprofundus ferrooxydans]